MRKFNIKIDLSRFFVVPREETEFWVKKVIGQLTTKNKQLGIFNKRQKNYKILDLFSGTGFIGIALLEACPEICRRVDFGDVDKRALEQIKINLKINQIKSPRAKIIKTDIFSNIKRKYDLIFANPPYVAQERLQEVQSSVKNFEPEVAWYAGKEGLMVISKFLKEAKKFLRESGIIFMEFDSSQKEKIKKLLVRYKYPRFNFYKDQFRKHRWVKIMKTP